MSNTASRWANVPEPVARVVELMSGYSAPWYLCGGWAVDAWIGEQTRQHDDADIVIFREDGAAIMAHLAGWHLVAHEVGGDQGTAETWDGHLLAVPAHIHGRPPDIDSPLPDRVENAAGQGYGLDIQVNERSGDEWVLAQEPRVALPLSGVARESDWGLPTLVPEILLFYKAADLRRRDEADFRRLLPLLSAEKRTWLREAIELVYPHRWLATLSA